jgi:hypothetical protein
MVKRYLPPRNDDGSYTTWGKYSQHRFAANNRGIAFNLTFDEWKAIWRASGHFEERGRRKGQYVMARIGDQGAYEPGNVAIITSEQNHAEGNKSKRGRTMRTWAMTQYHELQLDLVERLLGRGWKQARIAKRMGFASYSRVSQLVRELKDAGRVDWRRPDRVVADAEFTRVLISVERERRL